MSKHVPLEEMSLESFVIHAVSRESAEGFCSALVGSGFRPKLVVGGDGHCQIEVPLGGSDTEIIDALHAWRHM